MLQAPFFRTRESRLQTRPPSPQRLNSRRAGTPLPQSQHQVGPRTGPRLPSARPGSRAHRAGPGRSRGVTHRVGCPVSPRTQHSRDSRTPWHDGALSARPPSARNVATLREKLHVHLNLIRVRVTWTRTGGSHTRPVPPSRTGHRGGPPNTVSTRDRGGCPRPRAAPRTGDLAGTEDGRAPGRGRGGQCSVVGKVPRSRKRQCDGHGRRGCAQGPARAPAGVVTVVATWTYFITIKNDGRDAGQGDTDPQGGGTVVTGQSSGSRPRSRQGSGGPGDHQSWERPGPMRPQTPPRKGQSCGHGDPETVAPGAGRRIPARAPRRRAHPRAPAPGRPQDAAAASGSAIFCSTLIPHFHSALILIPPRPPIFRVNYTAPDHSGSLQGKARLPSGLRAGLGVGLARPHPAAARAPGLPGLLPSVAGRPRPAPGKLRHTGPVGLRGQGHAGPQRGSRPGCCTRHGISPLSPDEAAIRRA